jgi:RHS repeat-associated protein
MRNLAYIRTLAIFMSILIVMLPVAFAEELNLETDLNGNLITGDSLYREFNEQNQLIRIREGNTSSGDILFEYIHHPLEERVLVKDVYKNGVLNYSIYYVNDNYIHIENSSGNYSEKYLYIDNQLVAFVDTDGNKRFVHSDHLGSTSLVTDENGNTIENSFYSPFGEEIEKGNSRFGYEGKEFDEKTKDTDFHFRKYRPDWGRFTQPDSLISNVYEPQTLNRFAFEKNNPYRYTDPDGHNPFLAGLVALGRAALIKCASSQACTTATILGLKALNSQLKSDKLARRILDLEIDVEFDPGRKDGSVCQEDFSNYVCSTGDGEKKEDDTLPTGTELVDEAKAVSDASNGNGGGGSLIIPKKPEEADQTKPKPGGSGGGGSGNPAPEAPEGGHSGGDPGGGSCGCGCDVSCAV